MFRSIVNLFVQKMSEIIKFNDGEQQYIVTTVIAAQFYKYAFIWYKIGL